MCDIFPEFDNCCLILNLRIGMLLIAILAIISGGIMLSAIEQSSNVSYDNLKHVTQITDPKKAYSQLGDLITSGLTFMSVCFMLMGAVLLYANLFDSVGFIQAFVWATFANVIFGFFLVIGICFECMFGEDACILKNMDWLSASAFLVVVVLLLFAWIYLIIVANSYVMQEGG